MISGILKLLAGLGLLRLLSSKSGGGGALLLLVAVVVGALVFNLGRDVPPPGMGTAEAYQLDEIEPETQDLLPVEPQSFTIEVQPAMPGSVGI